MLRSLHVEQRCRVSIVFSIRGRGARRLAVHAGGHRPPAATAAAERDWMPAYAVQRGRLLPYEAGTACGAAKHALGDLHGPEALPVRAPSPRGGSRSGSRQVARSFEAMAVCGRQSVRSGGV